MNDLSPAPGVEQTATKASVATVLGFVAAFGTALLTVWTDSDPLTGRDFVVALVFALVGGGITGGSVYQAKNRRK